MKDFGSPFIEIQRLVCPVLCVSTFRGYLNTAVYHSLHENIFFKMVSQFSEYLSTQLGQQTSYVFFRGKVCLFPFLPLNDRKHHHQLTVKVLFCPCIFQEDEKEHLSRREKAMEKKSGGD